MLPFGVTIPATVPQGSEIPEGLMNNPVFARAGSSGIVYDFEVYVGKGTVKKVSPLGISEDIVLRLVDGLPKRQNYKVFMDN